MIHQMIEGQLMFYICDIPGHRKVDTLCIKYLL